MALVLAVAGAATLAVPWRGASAEVLVGAAVGMPLLALYVLARLPDPFGGATPLLAGAALAAAGALRAMLAEELPDILGPLAWAQAGLGAMALGLAALCRAADLPGGAGAAAGAALLLMPAHALTVTLLAIGTAAVARGAASRRLDRLGGLLHAMPWTGWCVLAGALSAAALPPLAGFAGTWLVLQSALGAWRAGGLLQQVAVGLSLALAGLALGLTAAAMIRLLGIAFLGRPRTPRAAGAEDPPWPARLALLAAAGLLALAGLFPGPVLLLAGAAAEVLVGQDLSARAGPFSVTAGDGQGYAPLLLGLLLAFAGVAAWAATRGAGPAERGPAWDDGFEAPPPH
ncbi:MAG TPA: proton-conducting transporter membrane subunit, partial [Acetobacteraceae bacterium]|nr:proton-conducting transporter membrane subunit [Acetobacteraceae bacterium]